MNNSRQITKTWLAVLAICLLSVSPAAFAYLDPSTGSMILSAIVGIFATLGLAVKTYWYKIKSFINGNQQGQQAARASVEADEQGDNVG